MTSSHDFQDIPALMRAPKSGQAIVTRIDDGRARIPAALGTQKGRTSRSAPLYPGFGGYAPWGAVSPDPPNFLPDFGMAEPRRGVTFAGPLGSLGRSI